MLASARIVPTLMFPEKRGRSSLRFFHYGSHSSRGPPREPTDERRRFRGISRLIEFFLEESPFLGTRRAVADRRVSRRAGAATSGASARTFIPGSPARERRPSFRDGAYIRRALPAKRQIYDEDVSFLRENAFRSSSSASRDSREERRALHERARLMMSIRELFAIK